MDMPLDLARFGAWLPFSDALRPLNSEQMLPDDEQIGKRAGDEEAIGVLRDAAVAHLGEAEVESSNNRPSNEAGPAPAAALPAPTEPTKPSGGKPQLRRIK